MYSVRCGRILKVLFSTIWVLSMKMMSYKDIFRDRSLNTFFWKPFVIKIQSSFLVRESAL